MALLQFHFTIAPATASLAVNHHQPLPRFCKPPFALYSTPNTGCRLDKPLSLNNKERSAVIAKASEGAADSVGPETPSEKAEESVPVEKLPLESKVQMHLEQRLKMKLAKKLRLRRKRLVRKRHLRKKGRWPPSKMKKNKNV